MGDNRLCLFVQPNSRAVSSQVRDLTPVSSTVRRCCRAASMRLATLSTLGLLLLLAISLIPAAAFAQDSKEIATPGRVVILNSSDPYLPAFRSFESGLRETVIASSRHPAELYAETLDMHRFPHKVLDTDVVQLLQRKYQDLKVEVVVAVAPIALKFAEQHRDQIWPGATIVFTNVSSQLLDQRQLPPDVIGVPHQLDFGQTLDLALRLRPNTQTVAVVGDAPRPCCEFLQLARDALAPLEHEGRIHTRYLIGLSIAETLTAVAALPPDTIVLYLVIYRDLDGQPKVPRAILEQISAVSSAPIFGVFGSYLGHGIVAGSIATFGSQGRLVGQVVARLLAGEDSASIGIQPPVTPHCMADWQQLRRWDIDPSLLPADCEVRFQEPSVWEQYRQLILLAAAVILAQAGWILALMFKQRRLRRTQTALAAECRHRHTAETLAAQLRARLARISKERSLGTMAAAIVHEVDQPLTAIQNYAQAAKRRLETDLDSTPKLFELLGKISGQAERAGGITQHVRSLVSSEEPQLQAVAVCPLIEAVIRMIEPEVEGRGCSIHCNLTGEAPTVLADPLQVQLVLVNLLQNATQSIANADAADKRVLVSVRPAGNADVEVSVTDYGPGVPPAQAADIFEHLHSETPGGMGLGLSIARTIIEAHGGGIWHEHNPSGGAVFRFKLRAAVT